ncbi:MAG: protein-tyrosine phosphatase family protein [Blastocatellia bacterium]
MSTWWINEPFVRGSSNPTDEELEALRKQGFSVLVSLLDEKEQHPNYSRKRAHELGYDRRSIPVRDFQAPTIEQLIKFKELIDSAPDSKVLIHCQGGTGRTGTFAAAYWIARGIKPVDAIAKVREARPKAVETPAQEAVLSQFADQLRSASQGAGST